MNANIPGVALVTGASSGLGSEIARLLAKLLAFAGELPPRGIALEANRFLFRK